MRHTDNNIYDLEWYSYRTERPYLNPVDIIDHVTSLARASRCRDNWDTMVETVIVSKNRRGHFTILGVCKYYIGPISDLSLSTATAAG